MATNPTPSPGDKPYVSDTKTTAPRGMMMAMIPMAIAAIAVVLIGMYFLSGMK